MTSFELSINFFKKIQQFFMSDFLHSKYAKRRRICDMSRTENLGCLWSSVFWGPGPGPTLAPGPSGPGPNAARAKQLSWGHGPAGAGAKNVCRAVVN